MADSAFIALQKAVVALLAAAPAIADKVHRQKTPPEPKERQSAINVSLVSSRRTPSSVGYGPADWDTLMRIECCYRAGSAGELAIDGVDQVLQAAYARLADQGSALGVGVLDVLPDPDLQWDDEEGETPLASATFVVRITHRTEGTALVPWN